MWHPDEGKGKGKSKGEGGGEAEKGKGKGKGYQGTCWRCGRVGHKAVECRQVGAVDEEADEEDREGGQVKVGTVWQVGAVEALYAPTTVTRSRI